MKRCRPAIAALLLGKTAGLALALFFPVCGLALFFGVGVWFVVAAMIPGARGLGPVATCFRTSRREVWLTIDDGPGADTPAILAVLAKHGARATFFVVGEQVAKHPELVAAMLAGGHDVQHHTTTHPAATFWCAGPGRVARELDTTTAALRACGVSPELFRPPAGMKTPFLHPALGRRGLRCVEWCIRSEDTFRRSVPGIVDHVMRRVRPGAIILLHEGETVPGPVRVVAIEALLGALAKDGWKCVIPSRGALE